MLSVLNLALGCVNGKQRESSTDEYEYNTSQVVIEQMNQFVKLSSLPWKATEGEIADFLVDCEIVGRVHIATNEAGRPTGDAFVKLASKGDLEKAMKRNREQLHNRFVTVEESDGENYEKHSKKLQKMENEDNTFIQLRGLIWSATVEDIKKFLSDCKVKKVVIKKNEHGRPTGDAFVQLDSEGDVDKAKSHNREYLGKRFVIIEEIYQSQFIKETEENKESDKKESPKPSVKEKDISPNHVKLSNLPRDLSEQDIIDFLKDVTPKKVTVLKSGQALIELEAPNDLVKCLICHNSTLNGRMIKVDEIEKEEVTKMFESAKSDEESDYYVKMSGLPWKATKDEIRSFLADINIVGEVVIVLNDHGKPSGDALVQLPTKDDLEKALKCNRKYLHNRFVLLEETDSEAFARVSATESRINKEKESNIETSNEESDYNLKLSGLPWKATKDDIRSFLVDTQIVGDVNIVYNDHGKPSGDALVKVATKEDLQKALKCNKKYLHNRFVIVEEIFAKTAATDRNTSRRSRDEESDIDEPASLHLKGLVWSATENDILSFLHDCTVKEVNIKKNEQGRSTGEAIVHLKNKADLKKALAHNREYLRERFVIVEKL